MQGVSAKKKQYTNHAKKWDEGVAGWFLFKQHMISRGNDSGHD